MQKVAVAGFVPFFNSTKFSPFIPLDVAFSQFSLVCPKVYVVACHSILRVSQLPFHIFHLFVFSGLHCS